MKHKDFEYSGTDYDLTHLHPFDWRYEHAPKEGQPQTYKCTVVFSSHCFTRDRRDGENHSADLVYPDDLGRLFDVGRYELSKQLPDIIRSLGDRICWHTHHGNFFTVELVGENGKKEEYEVYFTVSRFASRKGWLNVQIQSAYIRDENYTTSQPKKRKIGFNVIARNVQQKKTIKPPS